MTLHRVALWSALAAFAALGTAAGTAAAGEIELPKQLAWTAYGTGSAGYNQSVAIGAPSLLR